MALVHPATIPEVAVPKMRSGRYYFSSDNPDHRSAMDVVGAGFESPAGDVLPRGFWFSVGGSLYQHATWEIKRYFYEVQLAKKKPEGGNTVGVLSRLREIKDFMQRFGDSPFEANGSFGDIEWEKVVGNYDGMIVASYPRLRPVPSWYNALGCPRGVVWNNLASVSLRRLSRPPTALGIVPHPDIGDGEEV